MSEKFVRFGDLFDYENKSKIKAGDGLQTGKYPFYTSSNELSKYLDEYSFNKTSLIFGTGGNASIHYVDIPFSVSTDCLVAFAKDPSKVYSKFAYYYLSGNINLLEEGFKGAGLKHISKGYINEILIPLPPLATQKRIAEILDAADALRRKDQEFLKKYDELLQSIYYNLIKNIDLIEKNFILDVIQSGKNKIRSGPFGSDLLHSEFVTEGITVLGIDNVVNNRFEFNKTRFITVEKFNKLQRYQVFKNDVLVTIMGTVGRSTVVPEDIGIAINTKHLVAITLDTEKANPYFISYALTQDESILNQIKRKSKGAIMDGLNIGIIKELEILLPSIKDQNNFATKFHFVNELKSRIKNNHHSDLFSSLIQKAFKGELV
jgi:type I restriction enzyme S subunit